jgi:hypothetical protein
MPSCPRGDKPLGVAPRLNRLNNLDVPRRKRLMNPYAFRHINRAGKVFARARVVNLALYASRFCQPLRPVFAPARHSGTDDARYVCVDISKIAAGLNHARAAAYGQHVRGDYCTETLSTRQDGRGMNRRAG